jgi:tRNA A37 threonylcarbamoyladenosine synthetase subunit TsaC/SUA5/YrdC
VSAELLESLLPGPVTLVFTRTPLLNLSFNPDTSLIGVRIPDHPFIR